MEMVHDTFVRALCTRCDAELAPGFNGRLRCPRMSACGFGGVVEDGELARGQRARAAKRPTVVTGVVVACPVSA